MAVAHDASSVSTAQTASFTFSHAGASAGVRGVQVHVYNVTSSTDRVTGVTYGGVAMTAMAGGRATDTATEPGSCKVYELGSGIPQGTQTVSVTLTGTDTHYATCVTQLAGTDTATTGVVLLQEDGTVAEQSVTDGSPGTNSLRYAAGYFGHQTLPTTGASSTALQSTDAGANGWVLVRETTAGQGSRSVGFSSGVSDDRAAVHYAVKETGTVTVGVTGVAAAAAVGLLGVALALAPTGVSATGAVGTAALAHTQTITGNTGTGGVGTLTASGGSGSTTAYRLLLALTSEEATSDVTVALTGVAGTSAVGTVSVTNTTPVTGTSCTGAVGTATPASTVPLSGTAATGAAGTVTASGGAGGGGATQYFLLLALSSVGASSDVTVALTGVQATGAAGTVTPSRTVAATGNTATGSAGTVAPVTTVAATGTTSTGAVGTVTPAATVASTGNAGTSTVGTVGITHTQALTGASATGGTGSVTASGGAGGDVTVALTGVSATGGIGTLAPQATVATTGVSATTAVGTAIPAVTMSLTGTSATGAAGTVSAGGDRTVTLTGVQATGAAGTMGVIGVTPDVTIGVRGRATVIRVRAARS